MEVPSYQMHRVLKLYAKRLERIAETRRRLRAEGLEPVAENRRQSVIDRVAATIIQRIQEIGPRLEADGKHRDADLGPVQRTEKPRGRAVKFHFHRIDNGGRKHLDALLIDNGDFVFQRVEAVAPPVAER